MKQFFMLLLLATFAISPVFSQNINIKGFGDIPVKREGEKYLIQIGKFGEFAFTGNLDAKELKANVDVQQLEHLPGFKVLSKIGLTDIFLHITGDGLYLNAHADTKSSLKKVCDLFKITTPYIEVSAAIAPRSLEFEGIMEFTDGPVEFLHIDQTGTVVKFNSAKISTTLEPGTAELGFETNVLITPTKFDPELDCTYSFTYDIVSQTLTGAGSMMSEWSNPLGSSQFLDPNSIVFSNAAVELGINVATLAPVNIGFGIEKAKIFTIEFGVVVSIDPVDKKVAFKGERDKMNANDFTTFLREGFGLKVPDVLPNIYYIDSARVLFAPNGGSVGEVEIEKGLALRGMMHIGDAMQGPVDFRFDMENEIVLHMDLEYDFKKFVMNEVHKVEFLAPVANKILNTFQVRKLYVDLYANKDEQKFNGLAKCDFEVFGKAHHVEFKAALDPQVIAKQILNEVKKAAGPELAAIAEAINAALGQSMQIANKAWGESARRIGGILDHGRHSKAHCDNHCVNYLARQKYAPILGLGNNSLKVFHDEVLDQLVIMVGINEAQTRKIREEYISPKWNELVNKINHDWDRIKQDKTYESFYTIQSPAVGGDNYRRIIDEKRRVYEGYRDKLWNNMLTARSSENKYVKFQNRWKGTTIHIENGPVEAGNIGSGAHSGMWLIIPSNDGSYVKIKNRWKKNYLSIDNNQLGVKELYKDEKSAHWIVEEVTGSDFVRLKNKETGAYLNVESGKLECSNVGDGAHSGHWKIDNVYKSKAWNTNEEPNWIPGNDVLVSNNGIYRLVFQPDGNLVLYKYSVIELWSSGTANKGAKGLRIQKDGNIVIFNDKAAIWAANCHGKGGEALSLEDDGNLVMHAPGAKVIWETGTNRNPYPAKVCTPTEWKPGTIVLQSANRDYHLQFQEDGNLMLLKYGEIELWSSGSYGKGANAFKFQADGNLVISNSGGSIWSPNCYNKGGECLYLQDDGNLVNYAPGSNAIWSTNTANK